MQPTVQSEQDKMVPIDTSGEPVEIEVKDEEKVNQSPEIEIQEGQTTDNQKEELEDYSQSVKRRIDKLTRKMREAERREQAAIDYAKKVQEQQKILQAQVKQRDTQWIGETEKKLDAQEEFAKRALQAAIQENDTEKQVEAQQAISKMAVERQNLATQKVQVENVPEEQPTQTFEQPAATETKPPSEKANKWADSNPWFNNDKIMTASAMVIHQDLVQEGFDVESDEYYNEISTRIRTEFPQKFEDTKPRPTQKVASAVRTSASGRRTVKLTPSQVAIAKKLGVPLEEYAKHVKEGA
jgi:hypothetical protein